MANIPYGIQEDRESVLLPIHRESLILMEMYFLRMAPVFYGIGAPRGDGSAVIAIPGFLGPDEYLRTMTDWLNRMGYRPYLSGIEFNADCPNILMVKLNETIDRARDESGRPVHLIGHSLGGLIARSAACQRPDDIFSVTTLGSPFRGTRAHPFVIRMSDMVKDVIHRRHGEKVHADCYTGYCQCNFMNSLRERFPPEVAERNIYTKTDGIVDWRSCVSEIPGADIEVQGTHGGLAFNPHVYQLMAEFLAANRATFANKG